MFDQKCIFSLRNHVTTVCIIVITRAVTIDALINALMHYSGALKKLMRFKKINAHT